MEEARQHSVVNFPMRFVWQFSTLSFAFLASAPSAVASDAFPVVQVGGVEWETSALSLDEFDGADTSIGVLLRPAKQPNFSDTETVFESLFEACKHIMVAPASFTDDEFAFEKQTHVHLTVEIEDQSLFPYPLGVRIVDGKCTGTFGFAMPTLSEPFSQHSGDQEFLAIAHSWGLGQPVLNFTSGTKGKIIEGEIELLKNFGREVGSLNASAICIHALANMENDMRIFGIPIKPKNYPELTIEIVEQLPSLIGDMRKTLGTATFALNEGRCVE